jgi:ABC-2 type transport system ATP-binding protein
MGLAKTFKSIISQQETEALKGIYFEIKKGELLGVMGHNGAGKTTLINTLCGLVNKDAGNARIFDSDIS